MTFLGLETADESKEAVEALEKASGFLRSQLASVATMRSVPRLKFFFDEVARSSEYISELIDKAVSTDSNDSSER